MFVHAVSNLSFLISSGAKRKIHSWIGIAKKLQCKKLQVHVYVCIYQGYFLIFRCTEIFYDW